MGERREPVLGIGAGVGAIAEAADRRILGARPPERAPLGGALASLGLHLAALLLVLISWPAAAPVEAPPIPIHLVFEPPPPPPPPPPPAPKPEPKLERPPPPGRLASDDFGEVKPKETSPEQADKTQTPAAPEPRQPPEPTPAGVSATVPAVAAPVEAQPLEAAGGGQGERGGLLGTVLGG